MKIQSVVFIRKVANKQRVRQTDKQTDRQTNI